MRHRSLAARAALAVALMVGFYVLALSIAALLFLVPWLEWRLTHHVIAKLALGSLVAGAIVLWSILPRLDRFEPPGPRLLPQDHPELFDAIADVATATGQPVPQDVYLVPDVNAWVAQRGGIMGLGSRPVMGLGLPLLQLLTVPQLRAVLAHEFGHFHGGDTKLGPWIYKTRAAIGRTIAGLSERASVVRVPFELYGKLFLRITHAVSRQQELAADALGAGVAGAAAMAAGLRITHAAAPAFDAYWRSEVVPLLDMGVLPPVADGLARFVRAEPVSTGLREAVAAEIREGKGDPYDTHPPLRERLLALGAPSDGDGPDDPGPAAITLLREVPALERALLARVGGSLAERLRSLPWEEVAAQVLAPLYRTGAAAGRAALAGASAEDLPRLAAGILELDRDLELKQEPLDEQGRRARGAWHLTAAFIDALVRQGWSLESEPGLPVTLARDGCRIEPFGETAGLVENRTSAEEWSRRCQGWGIGGLSLTPPAP